MEKGKKKKKGNYISPGRSRFLGVLECTTSIVEELGLHTSVVVGCRLSSALIVTNDLFSLCVVCSVNDMLVRGTYSGTVVCVACLLLNNTSTTLQNNLT